MDKISKHFGTREGQKVDKLIGTEGVYTYLIAGQIDLELRPLARPNQLIWFFTFKLGPNKTTKSQTTQPALGCWIGVPTFFFSPY